MEVTFLFVCLLCFLKFILYSRNKWASLYISFVTNCLYYHYTTVNKALLSKDLIATTYVSNLCLRMINVVNEIALSECCRQGVYYSTVITTCRRELHSMNSTELFSTPNNKRLQLCPVLHSVPRSVFNITCWLPEGDNDLFQLLSASSLACIAVRSSSSSSSAYEGPAVAPIGSAGNESSTAAGALPSSPEKYRKPRRYNLFFSYALLTINAAFDMKHLGILLHWSGFVSRT